MSSRINNHAKIAENNSMVNLQIAILPLAGTPLQPPGLLVCCAKCYNKRS